MAGFAAVLLAGCGQSPGSDPQQDASAAETDWCADPALAAEVDAALASDTEGAHNNIMVTPEEMKELGGHTDAEIAGQVAAWEKLSAADIAYQQCLRARQGEPPVGPLPGAQSDQ